MVKNETGNETGNETKGNEMMVNDMKKLAQAVVDNMSKSEIECFLNQMDEAQQTAFAAQSGVNQCKKFIDMGVQVCTKEDTRRKFTQIIEAEVSK